jgi:hypothetical protein
MAYIALRLNNFKRNLYINNIDKIPININETDIPVKISHKVPNSLSEAQPQQTTFFAKKRIKYTAWLVVIAPMRTTILKYLKLGNSSLFWDIETNQPRAI